MGIRETWAGTLAARLPVSERISRTVTAEEDGLANLYAEHYAPLVRMAALLVRDVAVAEDITQAAFAALHVTRRRQEPAIAHLRRAVVTRARDTRWRLGPPTAELGRSPVLVALWALPERQRETLVLLYYAELSEAEAAAIMGITRDALRRHLARGLAAMEAGSLALSPLACQDRRPRRRW